VADAARGGGGPRRSKSWSACWSTGDTVIDGGNSYLPRRHHPGEEPVDEEHPLCGLWHQRRCVGAGAWLQPHDRRSRTGRHAWIRSSRRSPRQRFAEPTPGRTRTDGTAQHGYLHCGPSGAGIS
jgi:6-phosphogluconate dehydrogenase